MNTSDSLTTESWLDQVADALRHAPDDLDGQWLLSVVIAAQRSASLDLVTADIADFARANPGLIPEQVLAAIPAVASTSFSAHLVRLEAFVRRIPNHPIWDSVLVTDSTIVGPSPVTVEASLLRNPRDFAERFRTLLARGYPWINLHAAGILRRALLVELEHAPVGHGLRNTPVNLSGPASSTTARPGWSLDDLITLQER